MIIGQNERPKNYHGKIDASSTLYFIEKPDGL